MFFTFSVMTTTYADSWSDMAKPCDRDLVGHEVKVSMTYISRSSDFALYLGRLFDVCTFTLGV